ncbi:RNA polymerase sigma factor SigX [Brevibacillus dissolubilis]|uniref:RNA polymerase sigma factor SigX n=1 Tax=Brevibacillus dissolubilis TaxID=1844116 RepID=UPI001115BC3C|nr:RNA polymerase sigma factor SigX [Brevibacillus dissolubilis]
MEVQAIRMEDLTRDRQSTEDFQALFITYYPHVTRYIMGIVKDQAIAEDLAQEVFLQFYHADRTVIEHLPAWLTKTAMYAAYNHIRAEKRRQARDEKESSQQMVTTPSTEQKWLEQEEISVVREVLQEMDERDRTLLLMKYSGFPYHELAKATGVEKSSVGTLLARAKTKFRNLYKGWRGDDA